MHLSIPDSNEWFADPERKRGQYTVRSQPTTIGREEGGRRVVEAEDGESRGGREVRTMGRAEMELPPRREP